MTTEITKDGHVWCPLCEDYVKLLSLQKAAKLVGSTTRSLYRYIDAGEIFTIRVAGHGYRVCSNCLLQPSEKIATPLKKSDKV